jgi:hypothetical protein
MIKLTGMKKILQAAPLVIISSIIISLFPSCFKDKCSKTYTIYRPIYKSKAEVRANIKTVSPRAIKAAGKLFVYGSYIFLNEVDKGIHIIDNSNPSSPRNLGYISIPGNLDLAVKGSTLYADQYSDLLAIDVSDPLHADLKKVVSNAFPYRRYDSGFLPDSNDIIVDWIIKDTAVSMQCDVVSGGWWGCLNCGIITDVMALSSGQKSNQPPGISGSMARFTIVNSTLYAVSNTGLNIFSIADLENPVFTKKMETGNGIETIFPFKNKLFIGSNSGIFIYDITNESLPVQEGRMSHLTACDPVIADDNYAFVTLRSGVQCSNAKDQLDVLDVSNLKSPFLIKTYPLTNPHGLSKDGNLLFICDGADGLKIYDAANVNDLKLIKHMQGFETSDVIAFNQLAIVVEKNGIRQFDYSDANNIKLLSKLSW